jgi:hypothetical protein
MKALQTGTNIGLLCLTLLLVLGIYSTTTKTGAGNRKMLPPLTQEKVPDMPAVPVQETPLYEGDFVVVNLHTMTIELKRGSSTLEHMDILSIGKPGSYYETIGGAYENDYKIRSHLSSIGHVYMPWSVHVFGNFFIHGIPYYPDGTKVSSEYSGGCIRLTDENAQKVYNFVEKGTPIVVTEQSENDFSPLATSTVTFESLDMLRLMAATVSLEVLTQDNSIYDATSNTYTTRRKLLPRLITEKDASVIKTLAKDRSNDTFVMYMNLKAKSLGLTNTSFSAIDAPAVTSAEDLGRFQSYLSIYKTYLANLIPTEQ